MMPYTRLAKVIIDLSNYVTTQEAAKRLGFHVNHIRRMIREGDLAGKKLGNMWFITNESLDRYAQETAGFDKFDPRRGNQ
jgi:excisionase family DNA binding protein